MLKRLCRLLFWTYLFTLLIPAAYAKFDISGYSAAEIRLFTGSPVYPGQESGPQVSWLLEPELRYRS